jgi:hypothetical protein
MSADLNSILQAMVANPGQGITGVATQTLLSQFSDDEPTMSLLATYLAQRNAATEREEVTEEKTANDTAECNAELERARERSEKSAAAVRELRGHIENLFAELETLRERNDALAQALGACALCWGGDVDCPVCGGAGRPGFRAPDQRSFKQLLAPVINRFGKRNLPIGPIPTTGSLAPVDVTL